MVVNVSDDGFLFRGCHIDAAPMYILAGSGCVDVARIGAAALPARRGGSVIHLISAGERDKVTPLSDSGHRPSLPAKKVKRLVAVGDPVIVRRGSSGFAVSDMGVSRAFDDARRVVVDLRACLKSQWRPAALRSTVTACTTQDRIGTRGATTSAFYVAPDVAVAFDVTHATDYPGISHAKFGDIKCGGGPVIGRGPNVNPYVYERLVAAAKAAGIPYQVEALPGHSGTDAWPIQVSRAGIPTGLVSVPLRYMHTPTEVICLDDLDACVKLFVQFALDLCDADTFVPGLAAASDADDAPEGE